MPIKWPFVLEHTEDVATWQFLLVRVIGFALIFWLILKFGVPVFRNLLGEREKAIKEAADQVATTMRETEQMRNEYHERLERIQEETQQRMEEAVREAEDLRERILDEARQHAAAIVRRGEEEVMHERAKAMIRLRAQFVDDVIRAAGYAAARSLDAAHHRRLVEEFVRDVGAGS
jgi:F-type H+-transporting ATPase subunit b